MEIGLLLNTIHNQPDLKWWYPMILRSFNLPTQSYQHGYDMVANRRFYWIASTLLWVLSFDCFINVPLLLKFIREKEEFI